MPARNTDPGGLAALALAALVAACGGDGDEQKRRTDEIPRGGTLRIEITGAGAFGTIPTTDPAKIEFAPEISELHRCCLLRTLVASRLHVKPPASAQRSTRRRGRRAPA
jgi:hypothetical protein